MVTRLELHVELSGGGGITVEVADLAGLSSLEHGLVRDVLDMAAMAAGAAVALAAAAKPAAVALPPARIPAPAVSKPPKDKPAAKASTSPKLPPARIPAPAAMSAGAAAARARKAAAAGALSCPDCDRTFGSAQGLGGHRNAHRFDALDLVKDEADTEPADPPPVSTSRGVASMCLSGSHTICAAVHCNCDCHHGRRPAA